ncbi:MAG: LapA family protein [Deltaproteobacteria bacterium]|nr:LapA family protein [Deltaproteobacteria bacterium]
MKHVKLILFVVIAMAVVIAAVQNNPVLSKTVQFRINPMVAPEKNSPEISLYQVIIITFLLGIILSGIYGTIERFRLRKQIKVLRKELQDKDEELNSLRNLPITSNSVASGQTNGAWGVEKGDS